MSDGKVHITWDASDVMRAFPDLDYAEAESILRKMSAYWKPRQIGLLRNLCVEAKAHDGEPRKTDPVEWGIGGPPDES